MDPKIVGYFRSVDRDNSGHIDAEELQAALFNGIGTPFDIKCLTLMIAIFDRDKSGTISLNEFEQLHKYITTWQTVFRLHDRDCSGSIDVDEFKQTLKSFNYRLSPEFVHWLFARIDKQRSNKLGFDKYVYVMICLQLLKMNFQEFNKQKRGVATMSFEQFLGAGFDVCV